MLIILYRRATHTASELTYARCYKQPSNLHAYYPSSQHAPNQVLLKVLRSCDRNPSPPHHGILWPRGLEPVVVSIPASATATSSPSPVHPRLPGLRRTSIVPHRVVPPSQHRPRPLNPIFAPRVPVLLAPRRHLHDRLRCALQAIERQALVRQDQVVISQRALLEVLHRAIDVGIPVASPGGGVPVPLGLGVFDVQAHVDDLEGLEVRDVRHTDRRDVGS